MRKSLLTLAFILISVLSLHAQEVLRIHLTDGSVQVFNTSIVDSVTFEYVDPNKVSIENLSLVSKTNASASVSFGIVGSRTLLSVAGVVYSTDSTALTTDTGKKALAESVPGEGDVTVNIAQLTSETKYYAVAYVMTSDTCIYSTDTLKFTTNGKYPEPEIVDLGLSVKWASWNVGAQYAADYGPYLGWGDPTGDNNSHLSADYPVINSATTISGSEYDIAYAKWGKGWMIPTREQWKELHDNCTWTSETENGVQGWRITSKTNGNSIFLPRHGVYSPADGSYQQTTRAIYWTSEQSTSTTNNAYAVYLSSFALDMMDAEKILHMCIRAVYDNSGTEPTDPEDIPGEQVPLSPSAGESVDLGLSILWANKNVGASSAEDFGNFYAWAETEPKDSFQRANYTFYDAEKDSLYTPDGLTHIATTKYDAARMNWGYKWRMPTQDEIWELILGCTWTWDSEKYGYTVTGPSGKSIFLPCPGYKDNQKHLNDLIQGSYWSDTNYDREKTYLDKRAYVLQIVREQDPSCVDCDKELGYSIRPVMDK